MEGCQSNLFKLLPEDKLVHPLCMQILRYFVFTVVKNIDSLMRTFPVLLLLFMNIFLWISRKEYFVFIYNIRYINIRLYYLRYFDDLFFRHQFEVQGDINYVPAS